MPPPDTYTRYVIDKDDNVQDPPTIARYERELLDATAAADPAQIAVTMEDYHAARLRVAQAHNARVDEREREDARLLAEDNARRRAAAEANAADNAEAQKRADAERLRAEDAARAAAPPPPVVPAAPGAIT